MKYSIIGFVFWVAAGILFLFKLISGAVPSVDVHIFTLKQIFGIAWVGKIPWPSVHPWVEEFAHLNLSLVMLGIGLIFIIIGMFFKT